MLVALQQNDPQMLVILIPLLAIGSICTHIYLAYVYVKMKSMFVIALAHIAINNAQTSLSYLFIVKNILLANIGLVLVMVIIVAVLSATGHYKLFRQYFDEANRKAEVTAPAAPSRTDLLQEYG